jgi:hypothetical protein
MGAVWQVFDYNSQYRTPLAIVIKDGLLAFLIVISSRILVRRETIILGLFHYQLL